MEERERLKNFIAGCYSKEDYLKLIESFNDDNLFDSLSNEIKEVWNKFEYENISEEQRLKIREKIDLQIKLTKKKKDQTITRKIYTTVNKIAVILFIPLLVASLFLFYQLNNSQKSEESFAEIYCPLGTRTKFNLPDGSSGWLNSGSTLKYAVQFRKNRQVELNGEAFFDVVKNEKSPFELNTKHFKVEVLGTKFNVTSYNDDEDFAVTLETGKVRVIEKNSPHQLTLKPGYQFSFDKSEWDASLKKVNTHYFTSWKDGQMMFRNTPFSDVLVRLGRWYNVDFICDDNRLLKLPYRATFKEETLEHVLELLTFTAPIKYELVKPKKLPDGTYEKQRIYIKRK